MKRSCFEKGSLKEDQKYGLEIKESGEVEHCVKFGPIYNPLRSAEGDEVGNLGELQFKKKEAESELGFRSEKPEAWPSDGPDCEANHLASYGVINSMDLFSAVHSPVLRPITILGPSGAHPFWGERAILACGVVKEEDVKYDEDEEGSEVHERETYGRGGKGKSKSSFFRRAADLGLVTTGASTAGTGDDAMETSDFTEETPPIST